MTVLLCTDGSDAATSALRAGLAVLGPAQRLVLATALDAADPSLLTGTGFASGVMSAGEFDRHERARRDEAQAVLDRTAAAIERPDAETVVVEGAPGPTLCELAATLPASVVVMGTRGLGGLRRAVLGSVSDHVVRNAPCPVLTVGAP